MKDFKVHFMLFDTKHAVIVSAATPEKAAQYVRKNHPNAFVTKVKVHKAVA